jgi:hypothetical protein
MINPFGLLPEKVFMSVQKLGNSLERRGRKLFGGNWYGFLLLSQSKLLFFGWLCKIDLAQVIGCLSGATHGMLNAYFAIIKLKVEIICFFNAVLVIVYEVLYASLWSGGSFSNTGGGYATRNKKLGE